MSLEQDSLAQIQTDNGTEYAFVGGPVTVTAENGDIIQQAILQQVASSEQENIDPQTQVLTLQPFTVTIAGEDGQTVQQVQILHQPLDGLNAEAFQDGQIVQLQLPLAMQDQVPLQELEEQHNEQQIQFQPESPIEKPPEIRPPVGKGPFRCESCSKIFPKWNQLQRHIKTHEDDKPFQCVECPISFNVEDNLKLHMATHRPENPLCPECGKKFSRIASLKAHIMLHEKEESLICSECGDEYNTPAQLNRHMREHREEERGVRTYCCRHCSMEFSKHALLRDHMKQHVKIRSSLSHKCYKRNIDRSGFQHKCYHCEKTFQKPSQLERHVRIHTGERPYKCPSCNKAFNQKGALQIHMTKHTGERAHTCDFCPMKFSQKGNLRNHIERVHNLPKNSDAPVFQCEDCTCVFRKLGSLNAHMSRSHSEPVMVLGGGDGDDETGDNQQPASSRTDQENNSNNMSEVIGQWLQFSEQIGKDEHHSETTQHTKTEQAEGTSKVVKYSQAQPDDSQVRQSDILQQALENVGLVESEQEPGEHPAVQPGVSTSGTTSGSTVVSRPLEQSGGCTQVKQETVITTMTVRDAATGLVKKHIIRKVNGVRWHQCTYCSKEFKKPSDLVRHIRIHTHEKPYKCRQCYRAFAVKSTLTAHIKTHTGIKDFKCHLCHKMFSTQGSLKVHVRLHTGAKPFGCTHCGKKFRTSGHRKSHMQSHFRDDSVKKPRRSIRRSLKPDIALPDVPLQEPILITDTGYIQQPPRMLYNQYFGETTSVDRPYKCHICNRGFKKSSHLKQHVRSHTGEKPYKCIQCMKAFVSSGVLKSHIRTHTGVKAYKCRACDSTFTTNGSLKRHMSTHSEVRPFMCPYCQKTFKTSVNCKKHMKTHRQELAMQALQQPGVAVIQEVAGTEIVINEVPDVGDEEETTDAAVPDVHSTLEVHEGHDLTLQQAEVQLQEQHTAALTLQQEQDLAQHALVQADLTQATLAHQAVIQDTLISDVQLQSAVNPQQVFGQQAVSQNHQPDNFSQSLLATSQSNIGQISFAGQNGDQFQAQVVQQVFDIASLDQQGVQHSMPSTNIQNILQTREPDLGDAQKRKQEIVQLEMEEGKRSYNCTFCEKSFKKSSHLKQHIRSHTGDKPFECGHCGKCFTTSGVLKAHIKTHTGVRDFKCAVCQTTFTTNGSLVRHMAVHRTLRPYKCAYCVETFRTLIHCRRHMKQHREGAEPEKQLKRSRNSIIQISEQQAKELSKRTPMESMSVSEKLLVESAAEKDRISDVQAAVSPEITVKIPKFANQCPTCPKSFKKPSDLLRHIRIHTGEKPFPCDICNRSFTVKSTLDSHMKTHQQVDKKFNCHVCTASFSTKGSMKVHMRLHTGAKPFRCPHCDQRFRTSGHRKSHILQHFKPPLPKKLKADAKKVEQINVAVTTEDAVHVVDQGNGVANQVISIDPSLLQGQSLMPMSLSITDPLGNQLLQGLDGVQLQLTGNLNLGQNIQISGMDPNIMSQSIQIDASLLQQLQQQGNINVSVNPNVVTPSNMQITEPNFIQFQQPVSAAEQINPNLVVQPSYGAVGEQTVITQAVNDTPISVVSLDPGTLTMTQAEQQQQLLQPAQRTPHNVHIVVPDEDVEQAQREGLDQEDIDDDGMADEQEDLDQYGQGEVTLPTGPTPMQMFQNQATAGENLQKDPSSNEKERAMQLLEQNSSKRMDMQDPERIHSCQICDKSFKRLGHLKEHQLRHAPEQIQKMKVALHKCSECDKAFRKPSQLDRHIRIHTGERPFVCGICNKAFNQKNALHVHLRIHSGARPHSCPYCRVTFTQKGNLKTHIKRAHHLEMVQSMNLPATSISNAIVVQDLDIITSTGNTNHLHETDPNGLVAIDPPVTTSSGVEVTSDNVSVEQAENDPQVATQTFDLEGVLAPPSCPLVTPF